jgi:biopolymer transport protein ExbD
MKLRIAGAEAVGDDLDMTPMIDVVFQLIIFFMVASSFVDEAKVFQVALPRADDRETVTIRTDEVRKIAISRDGQIAVDNVTRTMPQMIEELKTYKAQTEQARREPIIVIEGDREVRYERIIQVWNGIKSVGITQVSFQVEMGQPDEPVAAGR